LINDVLDMAKIEAGRVTLYTHGFDLHAMLEELVELFQLRAAEKRLALILIRDPGVPRFVRTDESKLRQVLINLLGNAVKFTMTGNICLSVQRAATSAGWQLVFEVQDTGPGIAPGDSSLIFEPFVQATSGRTAQEGTGLGLPISRHYARLMGGDLSVISSGVSGEGSLFMLTMPLQVADEAELAEREQRTHSKAIRLEDGQPTYRLLVVDDRVESCTLLAKLLTQLGFAVRTAENGVQAIQIWEEWQPHLIWMDMRMPVMNGHEATRRIKATAQGQNTVVIAVTASVLADQRASVLADGCDDFVRKPYREDEIVDQLIKHLGVRMVYAQNGGPSEAQPVADAGPPEFDTVHLPARWTIQVRQAALAADAERILKLAAEVATEQPALADALLGWVDDYNYRAILHAVTLKEDNRL
jgi:CheY-like chemotaxis protein